MTYGLGKRANFTTLHHVRLPTKKTRSMPKISSPQAEILIFERFKEAFKKKYGVDLINVVHCDSPDFEAVVPNTGSNIGIEITGVYQNTYEAKIQNWAVEKWGRLTGSLEDLVLKLNEGLRKKAQKSFSYDYSGRLVLAIWLGSLIYHTKYDVDFFRHDIVIPENAYSNIWLIVRNQDDGSPELYHLQGKEVE